MDCDELHPAVASIIEGWMAPVRAALGEKLVGVTVTGSLALDDFQPGWSDVDLVAVLGGPITSGEVAELDRIHADIGRMYIDEGRDGWISGQGLQCCYLTADVAHSPGLRAACCEGGDRGAEAVGADPLLPFDRHVLSRFGRPLLGDPVGFEPPGIEALRVQSASEADWLDPARAARESPIWLAAVMHWLARTIVFWRDGADLGKTTALEREIARGSPFTEEFALALRIRRQGSRAAAGHERELREVFRRVASPSAVLIGGLLAG